MKLQSKDILQAGFTLIETLVAITVFILLLGGVSALISSSYRNYHYILEQSLAVGEARRGIKTMVKEIREARIGDNGSYPISVAGDKEFVFFSDIDKDGATEKVRYFLGSSGMGNQTEECITFSDGGSCGITFSDFLSGDLESAEVVVSVEGDFGWSREYAEIYADGSYLGRICEDQCSDCAGIWQGTSTFNVTDWASDGTINFLADATGHVNDFCDWQEENHAMKVKLELRWSEEFSEGEGEFKKGVIDPVGFPPSYPQEEEQVYILSYYIRNTPPIFEYFDREGNKIEEYPARLKDTKTMKVLLEVDVDPNREPDSFFLESKVQLRNLRYE